MEALDLYCEQHSDAEPEVLEKINRETHAHVLKPRMLSGVFQGRVLSLISCLAKPLNILEIGTYTGYSAICLAEGLVEGGKLTTIEVNEELEGRIRENIALAECKDKINLIIGEALKVIPTLSDKFDIVFIDADKHNYINYYDAVFSNLNIGGLIISDNVLWDGKVYDNNKNDNTTLYIRKFNDYLRKDLRTQKVLLPIRDGLYISRKIKEI